MLHSRTRSIRRRSVHNEPEKKLKMKVATVTSLAVAAAVTAAAPTAKRDAVYGFDISHYQSNVDFDAAYNDGGLRFVYIKATQGTTYTDPSFSSHYEGATNAG